VVLVDEIPLSLCTVYRYLCGIVLDDISSREQFAFLVYCYRVKAVFHNLCTVLLYWRLSGLTNSPQCQIPSQLRLMCMEHRRFSQTMASEWQTAFVISHKMLWCALLTAVKNYNKSLENCKTYSSTPRPNVEDQDFMIQDQDFHFCPRGASRPRPWSRGLHHWYTDGIRYPASLACVATL